MKTEHHLVYVVSAFSFFTDNRKIDYRILPTSIQTISFHQRITPFYPSSPIATLSEMDVRILTALGVKYWGEL